MEGLELLVAGGADRGDDCERPAERSCAELERFLTEVSPLTGPPFLAALLRHLTDVLDLSHAFVAEAVGTARRARTVAVSARGKILPNYAYDFPLLPCSEVILAGEACHPDALREHFSPAVLPGGERLDSYCGLRLSGFGRSAAWIAVMGEGRIADVEAVRSLLRLHAPRAAAELSRIRADIHSREVREGLEGLVQSLRTEVAEAERKLEHEVAERERSAMGLRLSDERFSKAFRSIPALLSISTRVDGRFVEVNDTFVRVTGYGREEVIGRTGSELGLWADPQERERLVRVLQVEGTLRNREFEIRARSGEVRIVLVSAELIQLEELCVLSAGIDITERKRAEAALRESEERYALAARGANDGLWDWNLEAGEIYYSPRWKNMLGHAEEQVGTAPTEWSSRIHPDDRDRVSMEIAAHLEALTAHFESEHRVRHRDGGYRWMLCRGLAVRDEFGRAYRLVGSLTDVTQRKAMEEQLIHDAFHDGLTGLPNRALFMDRLDRAVERARRHEAYSFAVLFLDLDRFKVVNDSLGHIVGDRLLTGVAHRIEACLRPEDTVARLGGDEFAVLLEGIEDCSDATRVAGRIGEAMRLPLDVGGQDVFTSVSVGIAVSHTGYQRPEELLRDADTAMYRAKARGRARYEVFDPAMHLRAVALLQLETDLRRAVEREEFGVCYQPIVSLETGELAGFEALARWQHPSRGMVPPAEFVELAEETGLIVPLGNWVLREACRQAARWRQQLGVALPVSVNLSGRQLMQPDLVERIAEILRETDMEGRLLNLEITETVIMENAESAAEMLVRLKRLDINVSVDDFGTGYSCLSLLHKFPIDVLKVDRSFVSRMGAPGEGGETVRTIITLARNLRMDVVAEGVETREQLESLKGLACGYAQGHLFAAALDGDAAAALIAEGRRW